MSASPDRYAKESQTTQTGRFLRRIHSSRNEILQYAHETRSLTIWSWPVEIATGDRMSPMALREHLLSPENLSPRCLCTTAEIDTHSTGSSSYITQARTGLHAGEYVFQCSANRCGYIAPLERIYRNRNSVRSILPRSGILNPLRGLSRSRRSLKRTYAALDVSEAGQIPPLQLPLQSPGSAFTIQRREPTRQYTTDTDLLMRLNSWTQPGLYEREFRALMGRMRQCSCGMIMAHDMFNEHRCERGLFRPMKRIKTE